MEFVFYSGLRDPTKKIQNTNGGGRRPRQGPSRFHARVHSGHGALRVPRYYETYGKKKIHLVSIRDPLYFVFFLSGLGDPSKIQIPFRALFHWKMEMEKRGGCMEIWDHDNMVGTRGCMVCNFPIRHDEWSRGIERVRCCSPRFMLHVRCCSPRFMLHVRCFVPASCCTCGAVLPASCCTCAACGALPRVRRGFLPKTFHYVHTLQSTLRTPGHAAPAPT